MTIGHHQSTIEILGVFVRANQAGIGWISRAEALLNLQVEDLETTLQVVTRQTHHLSCIGLLDCRRSPGRTGRRGPNGYQYRVTPAGIKRYDQLMSKFLGVKRWKAFQKWELKQS